MNMGEHNSDLYEQQLFAVFESCLTKEENELVESNLFSICDKLHLDGLTEELRLCIHKHPEKQTISFQEFRDGLLLLLKKFQGLITDKQCIVQPYYDPSTCDVNNKKDEVPPSIDTISRLYLQKMETGITMGESRLMLLWEKIKIYLKDRTDYTALQLISSCVGIPELPNQITESVFERLDRNCDGLISLDEFVIIFQKRRNIEALQELNKSRSGIANFNVNTLDFNMFESHKTNSVEVDKNLDREEAADVSNVSMLLPDGDSVLDTCGSLMEVTNIVCDQLKNLNKSLNDDIIQSHINLLQRMLSLYQDEQRNLNILIESMKAEKEKMRVDMLEANERANLLAQEMDEHQAELEKTRENLQRQSQQRYAEIMKELSDQLNIEREMDAAALKSKDDQLQILQKENHDMKNKLINMLQDNQMLEAENGNLLNQIEKLRRSNNDLLVQMKILDAEHDEIQSIEAKQQEQVDFFVERIKQLQSEVTLLRDQNDELGTELEALKYHGNDRRRDEAPSSLAYDLQLDENQVKNRAITTQSFEMDRKVENIRTPFVFEFSIDERQLDTANSSTTDRSLGDTIIRNLKNMLESAKCTPEKCILGDAVSRLIIDLQSNLSMSYSAQDSGIAKSIASEFEMECEERTHESLRDLVVSKTSKLISSKRTTTSNSAEDVYNFTDQDVKGMTQNKTSLRDYPPRKEEHTMEQGRISKERDNASNAVELESVSKIVSINTDLQEIETKYMIEKKQLSERCLELERSLDLLKAEYEECEDYWAAKLEEERQLFEQEQKISDDKLAELINKIAEYEELISPLDKSKNNGRLSPIDEKFNLEQQYIDLEEEFEQWKAKTENDISRKNIEIGDLREKLRLVKQPITNDSWIQVPDEIFLSTLSDVHCKSSSASSIPSMKEPITNVDLCDTKNQMYHTSEFLLSNDPNRFSKHEIQAVGHASYDVHDECTTKRIKSTHKEQKFQMHKKDPYVGIKVKEEDKCEFLRMQDVLMQNLNKTNCQCANNAQQRVCCIELSVLQNLNMKLYTQERKKRQLQYYFKRQQQYVEKVLQRIMTQHQAEIFELQCLFHNTQERLQMQIQTTIDQADRLASADILVKELYIENACLTEHIKRLQERCLILSGLNMETTSI